MSKVDQARRGYRIPRPRTRIKSMTGAGANVSSLVISPAIATPAAAQFIGGIIINPPANLAAADAGGAVLRNYQFYKMNSAVFKYTPAVGTTTPGTVYIAYFDNPEIIQKYIYGAYTDPNKLMMVKTAPISSHGPVWMEQTLTASMFTRRPKYSCDEDLSNDVNVFDRTTHGYFAVITESVPFSTSFGVISVDYSATGYHLQNNAATDL